MLTEFRIVDEQGAVAVQAVLNAAAWTYVAVTLQSGVMATTVSILAMTESRQRVPDARQLPVLCPAMKAIFQGQAP